MKALVKTARGPGNIEVLEKSIPSIPKDDWVLIRVEAAGVCGTDLHIWHDQYQNYPPVVLGHEFSGRIVECGKAAGSWKPGDRVVVEPHSLTCGTCELCRAGRLQSCSSKRSPGWGIDGAFTEYVAVPSGAVAQDSRSDALRRCSSGRTNGYLCQPPFARGVSVKPGDVVVVTGPGPIGIMAALVARCCGAGTIIVTGPSSCERKRFR